MRRPRIALGLLFAFLLAARLCHSGIVWVEEAYPAAAAIQILHGKLLYRDFWFDKPPLVPLLYLLWGAYSGPVLRIAGALFASVCCALAYRFARDLWSPREGLIAAALLAFFLTFDVPSSVMALAPDLVMVLPHLAAVYLAWRGRAFAAGAAAAVAMLCNPKGVLVFLICLLWNWREWVRLLGGFALVNGIALAALAGTGALSSYWQQVWAWGAIYSRDTFVDQPIVEGVRRTAAWTGFHAMLVVGAAWFWLRERSADAKRFAFWTALVFIGVVLGWRFFPRYYFILLPPLVVASARGLVLLPARARIVALALLLAPAIRFAPRYATLAADLIAGRPSRWADLAMNEDSRAASNEVLRLGHSGDTLLVWGYRPDIFAYTRMPVGAPFLDSQPLTGVIADRHLTRSDVSAPELATQNRRVLTTYRPTFIVDGLGPFNPSLAIVKYADLAEWMSHYDEAARTRTSIIYKLRP